MPFPPLAPRPVAPSPPATRRRRAAPTALLATSLAALLAAGARPADLAVDSIQELEPLVEILPSIPAFSERLPPLWEQAIERDDAEPRRLAVETVALAARRGMRGLERFVPRLERLLADDPDAATRAAAATALVALDARDSAPLLAASADREGMTVAGVVEPALARWDHTPRREAWLAALGAGAARPGIRRLAIDALGAVREARAAAPLERLVGDAAGEPAERLAAARALSMIRAEGLDGLAGTLAARAAGTGPEALPRVLAVALLSSHASPAAADFLARLAVDPEPAVATGALERLDEIDAPRALAIARDSLGVPDAGQRFVAARLAVRPADTDAIGRVAPLLGDRNPRIRRFVAGALADLAAADDLRPAVIERAVAALEGDAWRSLEQAALLVGRLDHEPAADRLLTLLRADRDEVAIAAAWALRKLEVEATLAPLLDYAREARGRLASTDPEPQRGRLGKQAQQIHQLFGILRHREAEDLLREYVPKSQIDPYARSAAFWALGKIHEDEADYDLAPAFAERLSDVGSTPPELFSVRWMAAVALGYLRARSQLDTLREFAERDTMYNATGFSSYWAVERITGEPMPEKPQAEDGIGGWFLEPP